jgi:prepilin-type processing-associated H-X9-DG protein
MSEPKDPISLSAFSLLELLVAVALVALLGSLLLVGFWTANRKAREATCLSNLRQISIGISLYQQQNGLKFPVRVSEKGSAGTPPDPRGNQDDWRFFDIAIGGVEPSNQSPRIPRANERPLFPYLGASKAFSCPFDKGWDFRPDAEFVRPSAFVENGCSYQYNTTPSGRNNPLGLEGIAGKTENWVPDPARYILMYEPPACEHQTRSPRPYLVFWHAPTPVGTLHWNGEREKLKGKRLISPILFVDGHAAVFDFTERAGMQVNTDAWLWFKPVP